ncbi:MAG: hypothetical protein RR139_07195 [Lachnospiraceae bacterium]
MFKKYVHVGVPHTEPMEGEVWNDGMKLWMIDPSTNEFGFEFLRFREDSWLAKEVQTLVHVACEVESIEEVFPTCEKILHEPIVVDEHLTIAFVMKDGACLELMEMK